MVKGPMTENPNGYIHTDQTGRIGWLTIANPENRNAMNFSMYQMMPAAIKELTDADVRVIVVQGQGEEAFGAGSDISEFLNLRRKENASAYDKAELAAHRAIENASIPTIAMIHGACRGGGLAIALACDLRFASKEASFAVPPAKLGIAFPHAALESLTEIVGPAHAKNLVLTATTINSSEAYRIGLIHGVCRKSQLKETVHSLASQISKLAPKTLLAAKTSLAYLVGKATADEVKAATDDCYESNDYLEGIAAFMEKRSPKFDGT